MTTSPSRAIKLFGTEEPVTPPNTLTAGPLSVELDGGQLRYARLNGVEALRGIAYIVRDKDWGTYNPEIANLKIDNGGDGFTVSYDATCKDAAQEFRFSATITGKADGTLRFEANGNAVTDFLTNRTGFVVLHPLEGVSGHAVEVLHVDGSSERSTFPELVDPVQPFKDIRALTHQVIPGVNVTCTMEGDTFEMEDHRNWTDASYKTYVRPLALPWPYTIKAGETTTQSVTLTVSGTLPAAAVTAKASVKVTIGKESGAIPQIGLGIPPQHSAAALETVDLISRAGPQLLVCHFDPRAGHNTEDMARFRALGEATGAALILEAIIPCREERDGAPVYVSSQTVMEADIESVRAAAAEAGVNFTAVTVSPAADLKCTLPGSTWPDTPALEHLYAAARKAFPGLPVGGGMFSFFTELNRKRPPAEYLDFVTHTTSPIVHACDDVSVTENLESMPYVIKSARSFIGNTLYRIGPSAIGMRDNPYGAASMENPDNARIAMARMDPRQRGLLGAAWNLGYVAHAARGGLQAVTLSAPVGEFGIVYHEMSYAQPWFDTAKAQVYPLYHVIAGMAAAAGAKMLATSSSIGRDVQCVAYRANSRVTLWLANLTGEEQDVVIEGLAAREGEMRVLDETSFEQCVSGPSGFDAVVRNAPLGRIALGPYAVARLDAPEG